MPIFTGTLSFAQERQKDNPYAALGHTPFVVGAEKQSGNVFIIENFEEGSVVGKLKHNPLTGEVKLFDRAGNFINEVRLSEEERAFLSIDPRAEKYYGISPYAYANNNPVRYIDPNGMDWYLHGETGVLYYNEELTTKTAIYNDQSYARIGDNTMFGDMKDISEKSYSYDASRELASNNGYSINAVQEVVQEEERTYSDHTSSATAASKMYTIVNEKYGIVSKEDEIKYTKEVEFLGNRFTFIDALFTLGGTKRNETHSRRHSAFIKKYDSNNNPNSNLSTKFEPGDYITTYKTWSDYSKATKGKGQLLKYK